MAAIKKKESLNAGEEPTLDLGGGMTAHLLHDFDRFSNGKMVMKFSDTDLEVKRGDESVGAIGMGIGGTLYVQIGNRTWKLDAMKVFEAVQEAEQAQYLTRKV